MSSRELIQYTYDWFVLVSKVNRRDLR